MYRSNKIGFRMILNISFHKKQLRFFVFILYLLSCNKIINGKEARLQRRFMWKQLDMEHIVNDMATRANAMKNAFSDLMPTKHSVMPYKILDYLPSETTRIKYIIRNPTTNQAIRIINLRPSKKVIKIIPKPTFMSELKPTLIQKKTVSPYAGDDEIKKTEIEHELISEGRISHKDGNDLFKHWSGADQYAKQLRQEVDEQNNSWLPVLNTSTISFLNPSKPSAISILHTSIMDELLPKTEKLIFSTDDRYHDIDLDLTHTESFHDHPLKTNSYEVTENIAEESIALPINKDTQTSIGPGAPSHKFAAIQITKKGTNAEKVSSTASSVVTKEISDQPSRFLLDYKGRSKSTAGFSRLTAFRTKLPRINETSFTNSRELSKYRSYYPDINSYMKDEERRLNVSEGVTTADVIYPVFSSTTSAATSAEENKISSMPSISRARQKLLVPVNVSQNVQTPELRVRNRGVIKYGDKII